MPEQPTPQVSSNGASAEHQMPAELRDKDQNVFDHLFKILQDKARVHDKLGVTLERALPLLEKKFAQKARFSIPLFDDRGDAIKDPEVYNPLAENLVSLINQHGSNVITAEVADVGPLKVVTVSFASKTTNT